MGGISGVNVNHFVSIPVVTILNGGTQSFWLENVDPDQHTSLSTG